MSLCYITFFDPLHQFKIQSSPCSSQVTVVFEAYFDNFFKSPYFQSIFNSGFLLLINKADIFFEFYVILVMIIAFKSILFLKAPSIDFSKLIRKRYLIRFYYNYLNFIFPNEVCNRFAQRQPLTFFLLHPEALQICRLNYKILTSFLL